MWNSIESILYAEKQKAQQRIAQKLNQFFFFFLVLHIDKGKQEIHVYV